MSRRPPSVLHLDANLLVLLTVGSVSRAGIAKHKRLSAYDVEAYELLRSVLRDSSELSVCPNVLTEASNLLGRADARYSLALSEIISTCNETHVASEEATKRTEYPRLGLTDAVLLSLAEHGGTLLTSDLGLHLAALGAGYSSVNFTQIRFEGL